LVWTTLTEGLAQALKAVDLWSPEHLERLELAIPREPAHGDWTTNLAMLLAKSAKLPPRGLAERIAAAFPDVPAVLERPEVAGPGFLNFRYSRAFLERLPVKISGEGERFGSYDHAHGLGVLVEYVSANPTGPLNVVSARAAAVGAALVRLLNATGHRAAGEFYVNDAGNQVDLLGESLAARFAERVGVARPLPPEGYQGGYLRDLANELPEREARAALAAADGAAWFRQQALERMIAWQERDLADYGAEFARWFRETEVHDSGAVRQTLTELEGRGMTYRARSPEQAAGDRPPAWEEEGSTTGEATFLRTSRFGDDQDRVVVKSNGAPTYLLPDIAYHRDKAARGFRHAIDLWGPDHRLHPRMKAALQTLGLPADFGVLLVQRVNLLPDSP
jgi:arginyl-tRNA synthetase